jgi:uncharacterized repeat protein (TIGR04138 family)
MKGLNDLKTIVKKDTRYRLEAYIFVLKSLDYTRKILQKERHVTGKELLEGIRKMAIHHYGLMAKAVLAHWGVQETLDFGNIVFNMVNAKILTKTAEDNIRDFMGVYDFNEAFVNSYTFNVKETYDL